MCVERQFAVSLTALKYKPYVKKAVEKDPSMLIYVLDPIKARLVHSRERKKETEKILWTIWYAEIKNALIKEEDMYCNATAVLKIDSVYKQGKNYHPQTYRHMLKSANILMQKKNNAACWVMMMMMDFLRYKKGRPKDFCNLAGVTKTINKWTRRLC